MVAGNSVRGGADRDRRVPLSEWPAIVRLERREQTPYFLRCIEVRIFRYRLAQSTTVVGHFACKSAMSFCTLVVSIGLTPRKSLVLGALDVPPEHLFSLVRGLLDGDGSIYTGVHQPTKLRYPSYRYERLSTSFLSASPAHIEWLRGRLRDALRIDGPVEVRRREGRTTMFRLRYGKRGACPACESVPRPSQEPNPKGQMGLHCAPSAVPRGI